MKKALYNLGIRSYRLLVKIAALRNPKARKLAEGRPEREVLADDELPDNYTRLVEQCSRIFGDDIKIKKGRNGGGKITIGFSSDEDIAYFLAKLEEK